MSRSWYSYSFYTEHRNYGIIVLMRTGILKTNGVHLQPHEYQTVKLLLANGYDVELLPPSAIKGLPTPDIIIDGRLWEMKAPLGSSRNTIKHTFQHGKRQAENLVIDLRRCKLDPDKALQEIRQNFKLSKRIKRLKVITKDSSILDFS